MEWTGAEEGENFAEQVCQEVLGVRWMEGDGGGYDPSCLPYKPPSHIPFRSSNNVDVLSYYGAHFARFSPSLSSICFAKADDVCIK